jgi:hypothetical protein
MRVVIGGTRFIGAHVCGRLRAIATLLLFIIAASRQRLWCRRREKLRIRARLCRSCIFLPNHSSSNPNVVILTVTMGAADAGAVEAPIFLSTLEKCFRKAVFEPRDGRIL